MGRFEPTGRWGVRTPHAAAATTGRRDRSGIASRGTGAGVERRVADNLRFRLEVFGIDGVREVLMIRIP